MAFGVFEKHIGAYLFEHVIQYDGHFCTIAAHLDMSARQADGACDPIIGLMTSLHYSCLLVFIEAVI